MAIETPYAKLDRETDGKAAVFPSEAPEDAPDFKRWVFPAIDQPPISAQGELMLHCGALERNGWEVGWAQVVGRRHRVCEDSMGVAWTSSSTEQGHSSGGLSAAFVLADGVGGGARGDVASQAAVRHCLGLLESTIPGCDEYETLSLGLRLADSAVNRSLATLTSMPGASTLAAAWLDDSGRGWISRVGDARLSVLEAWCDRWQQVMADQSYANLGETPPVPEQRNSPARMVGAGLIGTPELVSFVLKPGELLMLSSDGLHEWLSTSAGSRRSLDQRANLGDFARQLAMQAWGSGSDDDISVLLVRKTPN